MPLVSVTMARGRGSEDSGRLIRAIAPAVERDASALSWASSSNGISA